MNTDTMNPQDTNPTDTGPNDTDLDDTDPVAPAQLGAGHDNSNAQTQAPFGYGYSPDRPALRRPFNGRMIAGVAEGVARYFGVDTTLVRIGFVVLTVIGGAGVPLYLAGLLLIPDEDSNQSIAASIIESFQNRNR